MLQQIILPKFNNKLEEQLINLFHQSDLPLHFNKTGNKEFTNYKRISITLPEEVYSKFKQYCNDNAINISGKIAKLIEKELYQQQKQGLQ